MREPYVIHFPDYTAGEGAALIPGPHFHSKVCPHYNAPRCSFDLYVILLVLFPDDLATEGELNSSLIAKVNPFAKKSIWWSLL